MREDEIRKHVEERVARARARWREIEERPGAATAPIIPRAEYLRFTPPEGSVDAGPFLRGEIAADMRAAPEAAGLSQPELAAKLRRSQSMVAGVEAGRIAAGARYVGAVLRACRLPKDWKRPAE